MEKREKPVENDFGAMRTKEAPPQCILFDLDGTLTDPREGITGCVQYALSKFGIEEPDRGRLEPFIGPPLTDSFREFYGFGEEKAKQAVDFYRERFSTEGVFENKIYPGIREMLADLHGAGRRLAVASSKPTLFVEKILEHFGIRPYFDVVVGSELDGTRVRKEEVVEEALRQLLCGSGNRTEPDRQPEARHTEADAGKDVRCAGCRPNTIEELSELARRQGTVMVGDRKFDVEGGQAYGLACIGVSYGYAAPGELEEAGADVIVESVEALRRELLREGERLKI